MDSVHIPITQFVEEFTTALCTTTAAQLQPRFTPEHRAAAQYMQSLVKRPLLPAQLDCAAALHLRLKEMKDAYLVGEMGVGKSVIVLALACLLRAKRVLIMCPPHLTVKWAQELETVLPAAQWMILETVSGVEAAAQARCSSDLPFFAILSRERAKLEYSRRPALVRKVFAGEERPIVRYTCPSCGQPALTKEDVPLTPDTLRPDDRCRACSGILWDYDPRGPRRVALADVIAKRYPFAFDLLCGDEAHELSSKGAAQALAFNNLIGKTKKVVALTGTLSNGKSTSLFHILWRLVPELREEYARHDETRWINTYGILETRTIQTHTDQVVEHGSQSSRRVYVTVRERPGISPALIPHLIERCVFLGLEDLGIALPPYQEQVIVATMDGPLQKNYDYLLREAKRLLREARKSKDAHLSSTLIQSLLAYPDRAMIEDEIITNNRGQEVLRIPALPGNALYPKEQALLNFIKEEANAGRRTLVYCSHTGTRDITPRLQQLITRAGFRVTTLTAAVPPKKRLDWLKDQAKRGLNALVTNPRLVATGLDLLEYPSIFYFESDYHIPTIRQSSKRSWRIGQTEPVLVSASLYGGTLQEQAWALIAAGIRASLYTEGTVATQAMSEFHQDDDLTMALIKFILDKNPQLQSAEKAFRDLTAAYAVQQEAVDESQGPLPPRARRSSTRTPPAPVPTPPVQDFLQQWPALVSGPATQLDLFAA